MLAPGTFALLCSMSKALLPEQADHVGLVPNSKRC